jgi:hypothetical protein
LSPFAKLTKERLQPIYEAFQDIIPIEIDKLKESGFKLDTTTQSALSPIKERKTGSKHGGGGENDLHADTSTSIIGIMLAFACLIMKPGDKPTELPSPITTYANSVVDFTDFKFSEFEGAIKHYMDKFHDVIHKALEESATQSSSEQNPLTYVKVDTAGVPPPPPLDSMTLDPVGNLPPPPPNVISDVGEDSMDNSPAANLNNQDKSYNPQLNFGSMGVVPAGGGRGKKTRKNTSNRTRSKKLRRRNKTKQKQYASPAKRHTKKRTK